MNIETVVWVAALTSISICMGVGVFHSRKVRNIGDVFPLLLGANARVESSKEFSASTVATTISLATVVIAFYELAPTMGIWLLWPGITTAMGLLLFNILVPRIWRKMANYEIRPSLHAYLGMEYGSKRLVFVASLFTAIGYLTAFAVELTVGSVFLSPLLPGVPLLGIIVVLAAVSFIYTGLGGFRTVVVTDRLQMSFIWLLLIAIGTYYAVTINEQGIAASIARIPPELISMDWHSERISFVLGILVMNLLTFVGNMGLWQRIAGSQNSEIVTDGLWSSVGSSALSWSLFALAAVGAFMIVVPVPGENLIISFMTAIEGSVLGLAVIFCVVLGLLGALLSTASTQLMAVTQTIYEDLVGSFRADDIEIRIGLSREVFFSRLILMGSAVLSVAVVVGLRAIGFSVADMAFAIYGAALGLIPPIILTLYLPRATTMRLSTAATFAVGLGFVSCWSVAAYGRVHDDGNLVFLSPIVSTVVATIVMTVGWIISSRQK